MPRTTTLASTHSVGNSATDTRIKPVSYISFDAVVGRNSKFHNLTTAQEEELGGVEYRVSSLMLIRDLSTEVDPSAGSRSTATHRRGLLAVHAAPHGAHPRALPHLLAQVSTRLPGARPTQSDVVRLLPSLLGLLEQRNEVRSSLLLGSLSSLTHDPAVSLTPRWCPSATPTCSLLPCVFSFSGATLHTPCCESPFSSLSPTAKLRDANISSRAAFGCACEYRGNSPHARHIADDFYTHSQLDHLQDRADAVSDEGDASVPARPSSALLHLPLPLPVSSGPSFSLVGRSLLIPRQPNLVPRLRACLPQVSRFVRFERLS